MVKHRSLAGEELWSHYARFRNPPLSPYFNNLNGSCATGWHQQTSSLYQGWQWHMQKVNGRRARNVGGPFFTRRVTLKTNGAFPHFRANDWYGSGNPHFFFEGVLFPNLEVRNLARSIFRNELNRHAVWTSSNAINMIELREIGERIMLSAVPTSASANALVSVGELFTEGKLFTTPGRALTEQNPGGEFLNFQFGVLPVVSDIKAFNEASKNFSETISQYRRDAGKVVRRKAGPYVVRDEELNTTSYTAPVTVGGQALSAYISKSHKVHRKTKIERSIWYSGAFEYMIPRDVSRLEELLFEWNRAYGIVPDPADIWELLPFSWLADWQTSSGNALRHLFLEASEGATQIYGYVMCHTRVVTTVTYTGLLKIEGGAWQPITTSFDIIEDIKQRERVLPFGITYTKKPLTTRQLAILGALGIAK